MSMRTHDLSFRRASMRGECTERYGRLHNSRMTTAACPPPGRQPGDGRNRRRPHLSATPTKTRGDYLERTRLGRSRHSMPGRRHAEHRHGGAPVIATTHTPTSVYRYYDADGRLIYVGITSRGMLRQNEHNAHAPWWRFVRSQDVEHYDTREAALRRETHLIQTHRPPFNRAQNPDADARRKAYLEQHEMRPGRCGHCEGCRWDADAPETPPEEQYGCRQHDELAEGDEPILCNVCGSDTCIYADGYDRGGWEGYDAGHRDGVARGEEIEHFKATPQLAFDFALRMVVDGVGDGRARKPGFVSLGLNYAEDARLKLEAGIREAGVMALAAKAAEVPF